MTEAETEHRGRAAALAVESGAKGGEIVTVAQMIYAFVMGSEPEPSADTTAKAEPVKAKGRPPKPPEGPDLAAPQEHAVDAAVQETAKEITETTDDAPKAVYADVQAAVLALAKQKGNGAVREVFAAFGVDHGTKLGQDQWADSVAALQYKLAE